jgi:hypothetical protein
MLHISSSCMREAEYSWKVEPPFAELTDAIATIPGDNVCA